MLFRTLFPERARAVCVAAVLPWVPVCLGLAGCGSLEPVATHEVVTDPAQLYTSLTLQERAITLATVAPYHTIQLVATPLDGRGEAMSGLPAATFRLENPGDTSVLQLTADGQVTALAAASKIAVVAELTAPGPVRHTDIALITVTSGPPPVLDSFSVDPVSPDDTIWPLGTSDFYAFLIPALAPNHLTSQAFDPARQVIPELLAEYASLDPTRATVDRWTGKVTALHPGPVRAVARTTAYGVTKADTALFTVTWSRGGFIVARGSPAGGRVFVPDEVRIIPNGFVLWSNELDDSVDVTFDDPTNVVDPSPIPFCFLFGPSCGAGNAMLPVLDAFDDIRVRHFPVPGVYTFHSTRTGATGRIIVTDELPDGAGAP